MRKDATGPALIRKPGARRLTDQTGKLFGEFDGVETGATIGASANAVIADGKRCAARLLVARGT